jgi:hypothetical protein
MELNPRVVFERMFGGDGKTPQERLARMEQNSSILDAVSESVKDLSRGLGRRDQAKLSEYLENVREVERRIQQGEKQRSEHHLEAPSSAGIPNLAEHVAMFGAIVGLDVHDSGAFMMARASTLGYPQIGWLTDTIRFLTITMCRNRCPRKQDRFVSLTLFADFLQKPRSTRRRWQPARYSLFLYGSGMITVIAHHQPAGVDRRGRCRPGERQSSHSCEGRHAAFKSHDDAVGRGRHFHGQIR